MKNKIVADKRLSSLLSNLFITELSPDQDYYRILLIRILTYCFIPLLATEAAASLYFQYNYIFITEIIILGISIALLPRLKKSPHLFGNLFIVAFLSISITAILSCLENVAMLLFLAILPVYLVFFIGLRKACIWMFIILGIFAGSIIIFYLEHGHLPWETSLFAISLVVFLYCLVITIFYEKTNKWLLMKLQRQADYDDLTQIYNRRKFYQILRHDMEISQRYLTPLSVGLIDLDHFKKVNDTYGHDAGDAVLMELVDLLKKNLRRADVLARYGGEEFMVVLPQTTLESAKFVAEKMRKLVADNSFSQVGHCSISVGITQLSVADTVDSLIKRVDNALYSAKNQGRNNIVSFQPDQISD